MQFPFCFKIICLQTKKCSRATVVARWRCAGLMVGTRWRASSPGASGAPRRTSPGSWPGSPTSGSGSTPSSSFKQLAHYADPGRTTIGRMRKKGVGHTDAYPSLLIYYFVLWVVNHSYTSGSSRSVPVAN